MNEQEPLLTEREALEGMSPEFLARFVMNHSARIADSERLIELTNDVLTGYGTSIEIEMDKINETNTAGT